MPQKSEVIHSGFRSSLWKIRISTHLVCCLCPDCVDLRNRTAQAADLNAGVEIPRPISYSGNLAAEIANPLTCFVIALTVLLGACSSPERSESYAQQKVELCATLISEHRRSLEAAFEIEMRSWNYHSEWSDAINEIGVSRLDTEGRLRDPGEVVEDTLRKLAHVENGEKRRELEYVVLGHAMSLEARRGFEQYCVVAAQ